MPLRHAERFTDPHTSRSWLLERHDYGDGDVSYWLTTPDGVRGLVKRELIQ